MNTPPAFTAREHQVNMLFNLAIAPIKPSENSPKLIDKVWAALVSLPDDTIHSLVNMPAPFLEVKLNSLVNSIIY